MGEQARKGKKGMIQVAIKWMHIAFPTATQSTGLPDMRCRYRGVANIRRVFGGNT
jgi:hypothetical protein